MNLALNDANTGHRTLEVTRVNELVPTFKGGFEISIESEICGEYLSIIVTDKEQLRIFLNDWLKELNLEENFLT